MSVVSLGLSNIEIQIAMEKGLNWILASQTRDGSWGRGGESTGGVLSVLVDTFGIEPLGESAIKAANYILLNVKPPMGPLLEFNENGDQESPHLLGVTRLVDAGYINIALEVLGKRTVTHRMIMNQLVAENEEELLKLDKATFGNIIHMLVMGRFGLTYGILGRCIDILAGAVEEDKPTYGIVYALTKYAYPLPEEVAELCERRLKELLDKWDGSLVDLQLIITARAMTALCLSGFRSTLLDEIVHLLLSHQNDDGSWGSEYKLEATLFVVEALQHYQSKEKKK